MYRTFHITILQLEVLSSSNEERMSEGVSVPVKEKTKDPKGPVRLTSYLIVRLLFFSRNNIFLSQ